ncbi:MAG: cytidine/deoxycytidylate deaminase family protein [Christensenellaceae bacterium]|jgi:dCMP deaminase|nr:cytidine/deoxycytidylate deaminase family protein [Christensenellaceae bacterium]
MKDTNEKFKRPGWDEYFLEILEATRKRSTCDRGRGAAIIVRDNVLLSTGYVGAPKGSPHCDDVGHLMKEVKHEDGTVSKHCMRTAHGEANAIAMAAKTGVSVDGATMYVTMMPCRNCAMLIANCGIKKVICKVNYHGVNEGAEILKNAGVELVILDNVPPSYKDQ